MFSGLLRRKPKRRHEFYFLQASRSKKNRLEVRQTDYDRPKSLNSASAIYCSMTGSAETE